MKLEITKILQDMEKTIKLEFEEYTEDIERLLEDLKIKDGIIKASQDYEKIKESK